MKGLWRVVRVAAIADRWKSVRVGLSGSVIRPSVEFRVELCSAAVKALRFASPASDGAFGIDGPCAQPAACSWVMAGSVAFGSTCGVFFIPAFTRVPVAHFYSSSHRQTSIVGKWTIADFATFESHRVGAICLNCFSHFRKCAWDHLASFSQCLGRFSKMEPPPSTATPPKLLDRVRDAIRARHYSRRTEVAYVTWIRRYIGFIGRRIRPRWA
jgi:hypothetical protein